MSRGFERPYQGALPPRSGTLEEGDTEQAEDPSAGEGKDDRATNAESLPAERARAMWGSRRGGRSGHPSRRDCTGGNRRGDGGLQGSCRHRLAALPTKRITGSDERTAPGAQRGPDYLKDDTAHLQSVAGSEIRGLHEPIPVEERPVCAPEVDDAEA